MGADARGRTSSVDRRTSPLGRSGRRTSSSPVGAKNGLGSTSFAYGIGGLLDGDGYSFPQNERAYRQPLYQETRTFGDYEVSRPPGLGATGGISTTNPAPTAPPLPEQAALKGTGDKEPTPIEVLITGMSQLQQLLLKKGDGLELETKGIPELPKLPEYNPETGAIEFQDYLYLVEQQIGSLASGAGEWWQKTLEVAQTAYSEYQMLSPVKRLGVKAQLTAELKEDRYRRLEKKVAAMLLGSLPKGVKDDLIAYRAQGVHQILYRLMVIFQPGGAQDRAQLLRQLDVSESAPGPTEAIVAIRRWYRLLQRASDLGVTLPDESLQVRSLNSIVRRTSEQNGDFKFRLALARTELQIDTRPNQGNVLKYMQHLLAELEQLGSLSRRTATSITTTPSPAQTSTPTTTAPSGNASLKGLQGGEPPAKGGGKTKAPPAKKVCQWFSSEGGCRNGKDCTFQHSWSGLTRSERCILCGSKQRRAKDCTAGKSGSSPERGSGPQLAKAQGATPSPAASSSTSVATGAGGASAPAASSATTPSTTSAATSTANKIDPSQMTEILSETNKMLKALTSQQLSVPQPPLRPQDPLAVIQQQLDEVRRLKTLVVQEPGQGTAGFSSAVAWYETRLNASVIASSSSGPGNEALLDSGASHPFRPATTETELQSARRVAVSLATGEERNLLQNKAGTLLSEQGAEPPLVPMGQLVSLLGCSIRWCPKKLVVVHPLHGKLQVRLRGSCPVLPIGQALSLIAELEQARMEQFEKTVDDLKNQVKALRDQGRDGWNWQNHLRALCEEGSRISMAGFLHRCPTFAHVTAEALLGIPEDVPCEEKDGWKLLKGMPWSRAKRKAMFSSNSWTVHLFSGNERAMAAKSTFTMRSSMWQMALEGDEVMVNVDVTQSRALDLNQSGGVFKLLCWAALSGKIKAIVGGPPRQSFPAPVRPDGTNDHYQKEIQLITRMMMLWYVAEEGRCKAWRQGKLKASVVKPHVGFMLEHPDGGCRDDRISFFSTALWRTFSLEALMGEVRCSMNGRPTVLGGNLDLWHLDGMKLGAFPPGDPLGSIWPMELVANVAHASRAWVGLRRRESLLSSLTRSSWMDFMERAHEGPLPQGRQPDPAEEPGLSLCRFDVDEWRLHLQRDHLPYRRDCRVCVERSTGKPHRRVEHPTAYSLSIDTAGPFRTKGLDGHKYLLVACYRFPRLPGTKPEDPRETFPEKEGAIPEAADGGDWLFDDEDPEGEPVLVVDEVAEGVGVPVDQEDGHPLRDEEVEALKELAAPLDYSSVYLIRPMTSRNHTDTLRAVQETYIQLRSCGLPVHRLHADRAREYGTKGLEQWAASRDIDISKTQGDDPSQNGTAERAVRFIKMRMRILLSQARELSGLPDETVQSLWPYAAETAAAQQQAEVWRQPSPSVARFGSKVFTKRKGYGQGGRTDLLPKWVEGVYLGPVRAVPGGHLVLTDEGHLWYTTNIRQFTEPAPADAGSEADGELPPHPPVRRVRRKSSIVDLAGGVGLLPGFDGNRTEPSGERDGLRALVELAENDASASSEDLASEDPFHDQEEDIFCSSLGVKEHKGEESLATVYLREGRFSMEDCLRVLESEPFRKTRKQRALAWRGNEPPLVHTTLGAYQRGPWTGITNATARHQELTAYLTAVMKYHTGESMVFTSMTVARDLHTEAHRDRFNMRTSRNYVLTVGNFSGGGIWQEGSSEGASSVAIQTGPDETKVGFVLPVRNQVVQVDPKKLHKTMPWSGGPKWTIIAHTIGQHMKLDEVNRQELMHLGFVFPPCMEECELRAVSVKDEDGGVVGIENGPCWFPSQEDADAEQWTRMWMRRVLDEEHLLASAVREEQQPGLEEIKHANGEAADALARREQVTYPDRYDADQWLVLCRLAEGEDEVRGVEALLETLPAPLKVVYTVALDEVKLFVLRWKEAIVKEAEALLKAGALVPLTAEQQKILEDSGNLVILPAKGVFTVKPPDEELSVDDAGNSLPIGSPLFYKRKARLVICGNFQSRQAREDSYAGGCQTDSLRVMLARCAALKWSLASTDTRNAFILAPIQEEEDEEETVYALYPPKVFQLAQVQYASRLWRVDRALYGFRRSPRLWGRFRDRRLRAAKIQFEGGHVYLTQHRADENIWSVHVVSGDGTDTVRAYINVYVDDLLYVGEPPVIEAVHAWITSEWKASPLTWASEECTLRFLGLEIGRTSCGGVKLHQRGYIEELLRHHGLSETHGHLTPCPQEWLLGESEIVAQEYSPEQLRKAQAITGELLWLSGKSRPDLMHTVATMSSYCLKDPILVERIGTRALGYLKESLDISLVYNPGREDNYIEGFSDASFAPNGSRSVGCSMTRYQGQPVAWRCGKQALVSLSVAEAELIEAINTTQLAYGISAITNEIHQRSAEIVIKVDNSAAVGLSNESSGTWKTRHLKVRAFHLREAVRLGELRIEHIPGLLQLSDLGTKAFHRPRLQELLSLWGLRSRAEEADGQEEIQSRVPVKVNGTLAVLARLVLVMGWMVQGCRASSSTSSGIEVSMPWELYGVVVLGLVAAIGLWEAIKWVFEWISLGRKGSVEESRGARRLRRLQQTVQEEVARYALDEVDVPMSPFPSSPPRVPAPKTSSSSSLTRTRARMQDAVVQTDSLPVPPQPDPYIRFRGPFVTSEHGDRVHYDPQCYGLRNAMTRRRQLTLCHYCEGRQGLFRLDG